MQGDGFSTHITFTPLKVDLAFSLEQSYYQKYGALSFSSKQQPLLQCLLWEQHLLFTCRSVLPYKWIHTNLRYAGALGAERQRVVSGNCRLLTYPHTSRSWAKSFCTSQQQHLCSAEVSMCLGKCLTRLLYHAYV